MVQSLQPGVRLTAIFDSCHSGSALDLPYIYSTQGVLKEPNLAKEAGQGLLGVVSAYARGDMSSMVNTTVGLFKRVTKGDESFQKSRQTKTSPADVIMWSGSKDEQTSQDAHIGGEHTGAMSWAFITALKKNPQQSYVQLLNSIRDELSSKYTQKPQLSCSHPLGKSIFVFLLSFPLLTEKSLFRHGPSLRDVDYFYVLSAGFRLPNRILVIIFLVSQPCSFKWLRSDLLLLFFPLFFRHLLLEYPFSMVFCVSTRSGFTLLVMLFSVYERMNMNLCWLLTLFPLVMNGPTILVCSVGSHFYEGKGSDLLPYSQLAASNLHAARAGRYVRHSAYGLLRNIQFGLSLCSKRPATCYMVMGIWSLE